jgi:hypothetical protein
MKRRLRLLLALCGIALASCGGGGGATATSAVDALDADVAKWTGTPRAAGSTYTVLPDSVNVTLAAFPVASSNGTVNEKILVKTVDIAYTPANTTTPALPTQYMALGGIQVEMGSSVTIPVRVAPQEMKRATPLNDLVWNSAIYTYYVTMTFHCQYLKGSGTFDVPAQTNVRFADFAD